MHVRARAHIYMYKDLKFLMNENRTYILTGLPNQSSPHTKASMMSGSKPLKVGLIVIVSILKAESDIEVEWNCQDISSYPPKSWKFCTICMPPTQYVELSLKIRYRLFQISMELGPLWMSLIHISFRLVLTYLVYQNNYHHMK